MSNKEVFKQDVSATNESIGESKEDSVRVQHEGVGNATSRLVKVMPVESTTAEGGQRESQHLHSDLLVQVL